MKWFKEIEEKLSLMETLLNQEDDEADDLDYKLHELHEEIEHLLNLAPSKTNDELQKLVALENKFSGLNRQWENPNDVRSSTWDMMFPDGEDDGFDMDDFFDLN